MANPIDLNYSPLLAPKNDTAEDGLDAVQTAAADIETKQGMYQGIKTGLETSRLAGEAARRLQKGIFDTSERLGIHALGIYENETSKAMTVSAAGRASALSEKLTTQEMSSQISLSSIGNEAANRQALNHEAHVKHLKQQLSSGEISKATFDKQLKRAESLDQRAANAIDHAVIAAQDDTVQFFAGARNGRSH